MSALRKARFDRVILRSTGAIPAAIRSPHSFSTQRTKINTLLISAIVAAEIAPVNQAHVKSSTCIIRSQAKSRALNAAIAVEVVAAAAAELRVCRGGAALPSQPPRGPRGRGPAAAAAELRSCRHDASPGLPRGRGPAAAGAAPKKSPAAFTCSGRLVPPDA